MYLSAGANNAVTSVNFQSPFVYYLPLSRWQRWILACCSSVASLSPVEWRMDSSPTLSTVVSSDVWMLAKIFPKCPTCAWANRPKWEVSASGVELGESALCWLLALLGPWDGSEETDWTSCRIDLADTYQLLGVASYPLYYSNPWIREMRCIQEPRVL